MPTSVKDFLLHEDVGDRVLIDGDGGRLLIDEHTILDVEDLPVPRGLMFIEQVKYTEPYSLQLVGGDDQRLETFLAQRGLRSESELRDILDGEYFPKDKPIVTPYPPVIQPYPPGTPTPPGGGYPPGGPTYPPGGGVLYPCGQIPLGGIIMWSGAIADIPECWHLCDGTPPTPDLRNRFIVSYGDKYNIGDTGGALTVDASHTHGSGTLVADNEQAHTHGAGSYAAAAHTHAAGTLDTDNESSHTHGSGSLATDNDTHDHSVDAGTTASDTHYHTPGTLTTAGVGNHLHAQGTLFMSIPSATTTVQSGSGATVPTWDHTHTMGGNTSLGGAHAGLSINGVTDTDQHSHGPGTLDTDNDTHNHSVDSGSTGAGSAHNHGVSGSTASDGPHSVSGTSGAGSKHGHTISGDTATGGDTTLNIMPPYYALAFIMRVE